MFPAPGQPVMPGCDGGFGVPGGAGLGVVMVGAAELEEGAALEDEAALLDVADVVSVVLAGWASPEFAPAGEQAASATAASAARAAMREDRCRRGARRSFCLALPRSVAVRWSTGDATFQFGPPTSIVDLPRPGHHSNDLVIWRLPFWAGGR
ncbi:hypothetical protein UK23_25015 [Lentzea aerocolonigenes]|uniref:Uncharacterized protein n=1 Tax=Lentzea aerocolonigenes TaxID=68170 RepID=A0A0F0GWD1_LENAE|nr:hypothetical protein UK23_25015 [Lentzea aerocolonigenes]